MSNTNNASKKFVMGEIVHVWETKGCRELRHGPSCSERTGGDYPDILPTEDLKVVAVHGSTGADVIRESGQKIRIHKNHVDENADYNGTKGKKATSAKPIAMQRAEAEAKLKELQEQVTALAKAEAAEEMKATLEELTPEEMATISNRRRERLEAESLFQDVEEDAAMAKQATA